MAEDAAALEKKQLAEKMREVRMASSRRMFDSVDADKSGFIDPIEFQRLMRKLDATVRPALPSPNCPEVAPKLPRLP